MAKKEVQRYTITSRRTGKSETRALLKPQTWEKTKKQLKSFYPSSDWIIERGVPDDRARRRRR